MTIVPGLAFESITFLNGQVKLVLAGPPGGAYELQGSSDLVHWEKIDDVIIPVGGLEYTVPGNGSQRFYRAVQP